MDKMDTFRYLVGGYYGISEMDNYGLKEFVLKEINDYIKGYVEQNFDNSFDYDTEFKKVESELPVKTKLQDSLLVLQKIDAPLDLVLLVKQRLKEIREEEIGKF
jgi:hypothetical protein